MARNKKIRKFKDVACFVKMELILPGEIINKIDSLSREINLGANAIITAILFDYILHTEEKTYDIRRKNRNTTKNP